MAYEQFDDLTEETITSFFEEYFLPFSRVWTTMEYRVIAVSDPAHLLLTNDKAMIPLGIALYLFPKGEKGLLPRPKAIRIDPFELLVGKIPFSKKDLLQIVYQFTKGRNCDFIIRSKRYCLWGEPEKNVKYVNFYEADDKRKYSLSFPITLKRRLQQSEIEMFRLCYESVESRVKRLTGESPEKHIEKWLGSSTSFFQLYDPANDGIFLTIHTPAWIKLSTQNALIGNTVELNIIGPKNVTPKSMKLVVKSNSSEKPVKHSQRVIKFPIKEKIKLPFTWKKILLELYVEAFLIQKLPIYNSGLLNPKVQLLGAIQTEKKRRILNVDERLKQPGDTTAKRFEQYIIDLFGSLGFICFHSGGDSTKPDVIAFFQGKKGRMECFVIECSEATKQHFKVITFFERWKKLTEEVRCPSYPVLISDAKAEPNLYGKEFRQICILTHEDIKALEQMANRNERVEKVVDYILHGGTISKTSFTPYLFPEEKEEAIISVYLDF